MSVHDLATKAAPALHTLPSFSIARLPRIEFGPGTLERLPYWARRCGRNVLLVTGARSLGESGRAERLFRALADTGLRWRHVSVEGEPSPETVMGIVEQFRGRSMDVVVGIGGGSVLDAGKAVAGLLRVPNVVSDFLEGVGPELPYPGPAVPFIAVPTTAGTGSEATKNAVLGRRGAGGFKKSFRDEQLVPVVALVDPDLLESCPPAQIAANAMDALTQLIESYVSVRANPLTDALAIAGIASVRVGLWAWYEGREDAPAGRTHMAYAALLSGICLAQTGLGSVHGLASPLGHMFPIPHGVVCGTLLAAATRVNIDALRARAPESPARERYARIGNVLSGREHRNARNAREALVLLISDWVERLELPRLSCYGVTAAHIPDIVAGSRGSSMKTNPVVLTDEELGRILLARL